MKRKISTRIEERILRLAKRKAVEEGRTLSTLIEEAIAQYLRQGASAAPKERKKAFHLFCERPMKIPSAQLRYVLDEDMWTAV